MVMPILVMMNSDTFIYIFVYLYVISWFLVISLFLEKKNWTMCFNDWEEHVAMDAPPPGNDATLEPNPK